MGWAEDYLRQKRGQQNRERAAADPGFNDTWTGGFISSIASGAGEVFGMQPFESAEQFRERNPGAGMISGLGGAVLPWVGAGVASTTARGAAMLEGAMARVPVARNLSRLEQPIRYGIAKEAIRYSPVEISRLGIGLATTEDWNDYGNLLADVGLSTLITGGFGGIGGFFRAAGKADPVLGRVAEADLAFMPTFEYRMSKAPGATVTGDLPLQDVQNKLLREVFTGKPYQSKLPNQSGKYVDHLEGGTPETDLMVNQLMKPSGKGSGDMGLVRRPFMNEDGTWVHTPEEQAELLAGTPFKSMDELAENVVYPREVVVNSPQAAGTINKALHDSAMQRVAPGVWMGKEDKGGLYVFATRLKAGETPSGPLLADEAGKPLRFYHGTARPYEGLPDPSLNRIPKGMTVYSLNPAVASRYAKEGSGAADDAVRVFPVHIKADKIADFRKREDFERARDWYRKEDARLEEKFPNQLIHPFSEDSLARGDWGMWENPEMLKALGWKGAYVTEFSAKEAGEQLNIAILDRSAAVSTVEEAARMARIQPGDRWFVGKTDKPQLFAPEGYKFAQLTVNQFAKYRDAFKPSTSGDIFNTEVNKLLAAFSPNDFKLARTKGRAAYNEILESVTKRLLPGMEGVTGTTTARNLVDQFYDVVAVQVAKEGRDPLYARLYGALRAVAGPKGVAETQVNKLIGGAVQVTKNALFRKNLQHSEGLFGERPVQQFINELDDDELLAFYRIGIAQEPAEKLAEYTANGQVSERLRNAVETMQRLDRKMWTNDLLPAFKAAGLEGKFDLLEGYIMPRMFTGDWFIDVVDEAGTKHFLANGNISRAKHEAQLVIEEAAKRGFKLKMEKPRSIGAGIKPDEINQIHDLVQVQMAKSAEMQEVVQAAMKRMAVERAGLKGSRALRDIKPPKTLTEERSGRLASMDISDDITRQDIIKAIDSHYRQLYRFAGYSTWKQRWYPEAVNLEKINPTLAEDLRRKANHVMGYEGQLTQTLNKLMTPIFGQHLGGKAATRIAQGTNELLYNWNLAIMNPTFALLNVLTPIQTTMPHMAFLLHAPIEAAERDMHMSLRYGADGLPRAVVGVMDPAKILGEAIGLASKPGDELLDMLGKAKTDGTIGAQLYEGWVGAQSRAHETFRDAFKNHGGGVAGSWEMMKRIAIFGAERSEELSRLVAFNSYYILGKRYFNLEGDRLYRFMQRGVHNSMFGYSVIDRSRMFTGPVGSMFGLFKNWQMHFIRSMAQYAGVAMRGEAFSPLLWQFGAAGAIGGMGALGPLKWTADAITKLATDSPSAFAWLQENWSDSSDEIYFGLPATFGATLQASAALPGTDVRNDITSLSSIVAWERAKAVGKSVGAAWSYRESTGQNPLRDPNVRDKMLQAFAPRAVFRAFAAAEGDYIKSMTTGYPQVRGVSPLSKFFHGVGLNQVEIEQQQVVARELWKDQERRRQNIQQLGIQLADAQLNEDWEGMEAVQRRAVALGVEPSKVYKSAMTRVRREQSEDILSRYDADLVTKYPQLGN